MGAAVKKLAEAEDEFFTDGGGYWAWKAEDVAAALEAAGFSVRTELLDRSEERLLSASDVGRWFDGEKSAWGRAMLAALGTDEFAAAKNALLDIAAEGPVRWRWKSALVTAHK